jgi:hypothetical protein
MDRLTFAKTKASRQIGRLIDNLPEPPVGPQRREYSGKFNVRVFFTCLNERLGLKGV